MWIDHMFLIDLSIYLESETIDIFQTFPKHLLYEVSFLWLNPKQKRRSPIVAFKGTSCETSSPRANKTMSI